MGSSLHRVPNVFDQYGGYENRLTHALLASVARSPRLLREFLRWSGVRRRREDGPVRVLEQTVRRTDARGEAEERDPSLPDGWLECEGRWVLLVESKLHGAASRDQLTRHLRTAKAHVSRETRVRVLALSSASPRRGLDGVTYKRWVELYEFLTRLERNGDDPWPSIFREYMEILERELVAEEKPGMATLSKFSGIPFTPEQPYTYREAKRLMGLMREDLHGRRSLQRGLGIAPSEKGRPAIRGSKGYSVWDLIRFKWDGGGNFGNVPHLDLFVGQADLGAFLWVPKHVGPTYRERLRALGEEGFRDVLDAVRKRIAKAIRGEKQALPRLVVRQLSGGRGRPAWRDADMEFDLHVPFKRGIPHRNPQRKHCDIWLRAVTEALLKNPGLVELGVGVRFPYERCRVVRSANFGHDRSLLSRETGIWTGALATQPSGSGIIAPHCSQHAAGAAGRTARTRSRRRRTPHRPAVRSSGRSACSAEASATRRASGVGVARRRPRRARRQRIGLRARTSRRVQRP